MKGLGILGIEGFLLRLQSNAGGSSSLGRRNIISIRLGLRKPSSIASRSISDDGWSCHYICISYMTTKATHAPVRPGSMGGGERPRGWLESCAFKSAIFAFEALEQTG